MKGKLCLLLGLVLLMSVLSGCGQTKPSNMTEGGADALSDYISSNSSEDFMLQESTEIDISEIAVSENRTVHLAEGSALKIYGEIAPGNGALTIRAESESGEKPVLDLSGLSLANFEPQEATLFEIRSDVELIPPAKSEMLVIDTSNGEWTSIKLIIPFNEQEKDPSEEFGVTTAEELLGLIGDSNTSQIELADNISIDFGDTELSHNVMVNCAGFELTLNGELTINGGTLEIEDQSEAKSTKLDLSGLTVLCGKASASQYGDIIFIRINAKQIVGKPAVDKGMTFEIPDSGEYASVKVIEKITPAQHEAKLEEDMTKYLSGNTKDFPGGIGISTEFLADGVLEIHLNNPKIGEVIGIPMDGGTKLILTGSVTFDGGNYGFALHDDSKGTATVDITNLEINGTAELGKTKSPDIFMARGNVKIIFDKSNPHIEVVKNDRFWLRYVQ